MFNQLEQERNDFLLANNINLESILNPKNYQESKKDFLYSPINTEGKLLLTKKPTNEMYGLIKDICTNNKKRFNFF